ncbi:MAG: hypothetical protein IKH74_02290 [Lachnospiraceae bacterium]|nr:hypothetical protein [Lachnospiraceae bacterium]
MNKNDLLEEALNRIDPEFAEDAARKMNRRNRKSAKSPAWQPGLLIAAAALLLALVGGGIFAITRMGGRPGNEPTKPTEFADQNDPTNPSQYNPTSPSQHDPTNPVSPDEPSSDAPRVDFMSEMTFSTDRKSADYLSSFLPFGDRVALYSSLWLPSDTDEAATKANEEILRSHLGELYYTGLMKWYMVDDSVNLKNLIREEADGRLSLWQFSCFQTWGGDMLQEEFPGKIIGDYEYKTLLATFYHVTSAEDIERVEILPTTGVRSTGNGTPAGGAQPILIEDPHDIQSIYDILRKMVCSGTGSMVDNAADVNSENFFNAVNAHPALRSSLERDIRIVLKDGSSIQGLKYSAFQCAFYENGGIAYGGLDEEDIVAMNDFAEIRLEAMP